MIKTWADKVFSKCVSATVVASLLCATPLMVVPSMAYADAPSCKSVHLEDVLKKHEDAVASGVAPVTRSFDHLVTRANALLGHLGKSYDWDEDAYLTSYAATNDALARGSTVRLEDYQTAESILAVFDASAERARAQSVIFQGGFSFGAMLKNATDAQRRMILKNLAGVLDKKGYKNWQAGDVMARLYLLSKGPTDTFAFSYGPGRTFPQAIQDVIERRLEVQLMRGSLGDVLTELGIGRLDTAALDTLHKISIGARSYAKALFNASLPITFTLIVGGHLGGLIGTTKLAEYGLGQAALAVPVIDMVNTRKPMDPALEEQLKLRKDLHDVWPDITKRDKFLAARQLDWSLAKRAAVRCVGYAILFMAVISIWKLTKDDIRNRFPKLVDAIDGFTAEKGPLSREQLEAAVYQTWHDSFVGSNPDIDNTQASADERALIDKVSTVHLQDIVYHGAKLSDAGTGAKISADKAAADMGLKTADSNSNTTDATVDLPPVPQ